MSPPRGRPRAGSLPPGVTARSASGATASVEGERSRRAPALWLDLLIRLLLPLLLIVAATGALGVLTAQTLIERNFDRWLIDAARSLAGQVHVVDGHARLDLGGDAQAMLAFDVIDRIFFSVRQDQQHVAGNPGIPTAGRNVARFDDGQVYDAQFAGQPVRVASVPTGPPAAKVRILVAETLNKRRGVQAELQLMLMPLGGLLLAAAGAIVLALRWTIRPLELIAARWNERSQQSLQPITLRGVPRELLPFATALNDLLARVQAVLERERRFAANAAHQIRTPLAGLQLGLSRAAAASDLASTRAVIAEMQRDTQRTARLLQQLLALGRLDPEAAFEHGQPPVDLAALAHDVGALYIDAALARRIDLELVAPGRPVLAAVHPELVIEALGNLVDNALRHAPDGGRVEISVSDDPPTLQVADSGAGLPADEHAAVLERFVRGRNAVGDGSGLGLAIVREIAELHRARLQLERSALGGLAVRLSFDAGKRRPQTP